MDQTSFRKKENEEHQTFLNRPNSVLHRAMVTPPLANEAAANYFIESSVDGLGVMTNPVLDLSSGAGVTCLGHSAAHVKEAMINQIAHMPYAHSAQWTSGVVERAGSALISRAGSQFENGAVTFYSGGSEAIEAAVKFGIQALCQPGVTPVIGRYLSYHGNSMFALAVGDHPRKFVLNKTDLVSKVSHFGAYAPSWCPIKLNEVETLEHAKASVDHLRDILRYHATNKKRCIVVIEPIAGTTLGIEPPTAEYLLMIRLVCNEFNAILIHDEILSGNYRTGKLLASSYYASSLDVDSLLAPDIAVMGKGITGGYFPMSAVILSSECVSMVRHNFGKIWHTSTNQNHPIGCAAVVAAMMTYDEMKPAIAKLINVLKDECIPRLRNARHVHSVEGVGTLWGVRFDPDKSGLHLQVKRQLKDAMISCYTDGGMIAGKGNMLLFAPPYTIGLEDLHQACEAIELLDL